MLEVDDEILRRRSKWQYRGRARPPFARPPKARQESVWDYPRPPRIQPDSRRIIVRLENRRLADSNRTVRVLETAGPPTFYLPPDDIDLSCFRENESRSSCEWKGIATGLDLVDGPTDVAWFYPETYCEFQAIAGWVAFYPARLHCTVQGEVVRPQPGGYYGGWVTDEIIGPFKGEPDCDDSY